MGHVLVEQIDGCTDAEYQDVKNKQDERVFN